MENLIRSRLCYQKACVKFRQMAPGTKGLPFWRLLFQNVISSLVFVQNGCFKDTNNVEYSKNVKIKGRFFHQLLNE